MDIFSMGKSELEQLIREANRTYVDGKPVISDFEYDNAVERLRELDPESQLLLELASSEYSGGDSVYDDIRRIHKMKSIKPIFDSAKAANWINQFDSEVDLDYSLKADGYGIYMDYSYGKLVESFTRGRVNKGNNILRHAKILAPTLIPQLSGCRLAEVRGEVVLPIANFIELQKKYPERDYNNPRNTVSSLLTSDTPEEDIKLLKFCAYGLYAADGYDLGVSTLNEKRSKLKSYGFNTLPSQVYRVGFGEDNGLSRAEMLELIVENFAVNVKEQCGMLSDGVVVAVNDLEMFEALGGDEKYNEGSRALKIGAWKSKIYSSEILSIEWSHATSLISPIAIIKKVVTEGGREVSRVALKNVDIMQKAKAYPGNIIQFEYVSDMNPKLIVYGENQ